MSQTRTLNSSFTGGEIAPELIGRIDLARYKNSVARMRNMIALPHGPAMNRAGTTFIKEVKTSADTTRLIPFSFNNTQTFALEVGAGYFRFHTVGGTLIVSPAPAAYSGATAYVVGDLTLSGGVNYYCILATTGNAPPNATYWYAMPADGTYEIPNTFTAAEVFDIHYTQSADVLTLVHPSHRPAELRRYSALRWTYVNITVAPLLATPATPTVVATYATAGVPRNHQYTVSATTATDEKSYASTASVVVVNDLTIVGNYNTVTWTSVPGAFQYEIYKVVNGLSGLIARSDSTVLTMRDDNITPDMGTPPQLIDVSFNATGDYPAAVGYYEQRRIFAGTNNSPQGVWMTRPGTESDMSYTIPMREDNALRFVVKALKAGTIRHVIPSQAIVLLTADTEFRATSSTGGAITPSTLTVKPQAYIGASNVQPAIANNNILYAAEVGGRMRELAYTSQSTAFPQYNSYDISVLAPHLFDGFTIKDLAYMRAPYPICWAVSSSGKLLGATYLPEQQLLSWHQHDSTNGAFESVCVITEVGGDAVYCIVRRTIGGVTKRYIERLHTRDFTTASDAYFVDCGSTKTSGTPFTTITGLTWLEGQTVTVLADSRVETHVVASGSITLDAAASVAHVGLPITAQLQTLPPAVADNTFGTGRVKNVNTAWIKVSRTGTLQVGSAATGLLTSMYPSIQDVYGDSGLLRTEELRIPLLGAWTPDSGILIEHTDPTPLMILSITQEVSLGN